MESDPYASLTTVDDGPLPKGRRLIADRLASIHHTAVPVTLHRRVITAPDNFYGRILEATIDALVRYPRFNGTFEAGRFRAYHEVNLGLAFEGPQGLVVPVLRDAAANSPAELHARRRELAQRATSRSLSFSDLIGGTFTVSNLGLFDIEYFTPVLNPPQVAILGIGTIRPESSGEVSVPLSLTFDHRVNDGVAAAELLRAIQTAVQ